ncbi:MAG: NYN domain-containing protein [Synergistaceae bacterium]|nr:NYN domain-containing protein [Synergistaceae bacterium]
MPITDHKKIALLIDAENTSHKYIELIFDELGAYGFATYKRVYGNNNALSGRKDEIFKYAMTPVLQFNYTSGKNASDSALIIDAMDILYTGNVDGFCLVTSDSDFTKLAIRLREAGKFVMGMGEQKTPEPLVRACEEFKYLDVLSKEDVQDEDVSVKDEADDELKARIAMILSTVFQGSEWVRLADLGNALPKYIPGFSVKSYGCSKLKQLMMKFGDRFEMHEMGEPLTDLYVRDKQ